VEAIPLSPFLHEVGDRVCSIRKERAEKYTFSSGTPPSSTAYFFHVFSVIVVLSDFERHTFAGQDI
jgi:hypothetical protein